MPPRTSGKAAKNAGKSQKNITKEDKKTKDGDTTSSKSKSSDSSEEPQELQRLDTPMLSGPGTSTSNSSSSSTSSSSDSDDEDPEEQMKSKLKLRKTEKLVPILMKRSKESRKALVKKQADKVWRLQRDLYTTVDEMRRVRRNIFRIKGVVARTEDHISDVKEKLKAIRRKDSETKAELMEAKEGPVAKWWKIRARYSQARRMKSLEKKVKVNCLDAEKQQAQLRSLVERKRKYQMMVDVGERVVKDMKQKIEEKREVRDTELKKEEVLLLAYEMAEEFQY